MRPRILEGQDRIGPLSRVGQEEIAEMLLVRYFVSASCSCIGQPVSASWTVWSEKIRHLSWARRRRLSIKAEDEVRVALSTILASFPNYPEVLPIRPHLRGNKTLLTRSQLFTLHYQTICWYICSFLIALPDGVRKQGSRQCDFIEFCFGRKVWYLEEQTYGILSEDRTDDDFMSES